MNEVFCMLFSVVLLVGVDVRRLMKKMTAMRSRRRRNVGMRVANKIVDD